MANEYLESAIAKIKRAESQVDDLNSRIVRFFDSSGYEIVSERDYGLDEEVWRFELRDQIPAEIAVVAGEVVHNVRSALDNLMCALAFAHSGSTRDTYFPVGKDVNGLQTEIASKTKKLPQLARDMIAALKPYKGGNDLLYYLHDLNRTDKHVRLAVVNQCTSSHTATYLTVRRGLAYVVGARCGQHLLIKEYLDPIRPTAAEIAAMPSPTAVYRLKPGASIKFGTKGCAAHKSREFLVTSPGAEFETDMKPAFDVTFQDVGPLEGEPTVALLSQMREATARIVSEFRRTFFP
ncbi:MAG: hypothetical protein K8F93_00385 [Burkholderiales bacterium]|nr:hypothetical protein [Burkholderiales bacterium]